jgi:hypothetical protein
MKIYYAVSENGGSLLQEGLEGNAGVDICVLAATTVALGLNEHFFESLLQHLLSLGRVVEKGGYKIGLGLFHFFEIFLCMFEHNFSDIVWSLSMVSRYLDAIWIQRLNLWNFDWYFLKIESFLLYFYWRSSFWICC